MGEYVGPVDVYFGSGPPFEADRPHEACGVTGIILIEEDFIASALANSLQTLQHRGQEAAGIAIGTPDATMVLKGVGLVSEILGGHNLNGLPKSRTGVGHVRYGTVRVNSQSMFDAAGPAVGETDRWGTIAIGHNGTIINVNELCSTFGIKPNENSTDTACFTSAVAAVRLDSDSLPEAVTRVLSVAEGAYSLTVMGENQLIGVRDPIGFRPLWLGTYPKGGYAIASERPAIEATGAIPRREIAPGEMVVCGEDGSLTSTFPFPEQPTKLCSLEYVYFSAPHGELMGRSVHMARKRLGEILAAEHPTDADVVVGVPDSGTPGAEGYAASSDIPRVSGILRMRYLTSDRTFITPGQAARESAVRRKIRVIEPEVFGKRVVLVDDSIVRGTTMRETVRMVREAGATEVHLRITSPPIKWPCFYGMDTGDPRQLIANEIPNMHDLCSYLGADSLEYLSPAGLRSAVADSASKLCMACMTGEYPTSTPIAQGFGVK